MLGSVSGFSVMTNLGSIGIMVSCLKQVITSINMSRSLQQNTTL